MVEIVEGEVIESVEAVPEVRVVKIKPSKPLGFKPGQYFQFFIPGDDAVVKPYSVSSPPSNHDYLEFCIKRVEGGRASNYMFRTKPGDKLTLQGPMGGFVLQDRIDNDIIFVATGTGISSLKPMIKAIFERGTDKRIWLFFGVRTENDIIFRDEFGKLSTEHDNFYFVPCLSRASDDWRGERGYVQDVMKRRIMGISGKDIYLCGLDVMVEQMKTIAEELGFPKEKIHFEKYV